MGKLRHGEASSPHTGHTGGRQPVSTARGSGVHHGPPLPRCWPAGAPTAPGAQSSTICCVSVSPALGFWCYKTLFRQGSWEPWAHRSEPFWIGLCSPAPSKAGLTAALTPGPASPAPPRCCRLSRSGGPQPAPLTSVQVLAGPPCARQVIQGCQQPAHVLSGRGPLGRSPHKSSAERAACGRSGPGPDHRATRPPARRRGSRSRPCKPPHRVLRPLLGVRVPPRGKRRDPVT